MRRAKTRNSIPGDGFASKTNTFEIRTRLKPHLKGYAVMSAYVPFGQKEAVHAGGRLALALEERFQSLI